MYALFLMPGTATVQTVIYSEESHHTRICKKAGNNY